MEMTVAIVTSGILTNDAVTCGVVTWIRKKIAKSGNVTGIMTLKIHNIVIGAYGTAHDSPRMSVITDDGVNQLRFSRSNVRCGTSTGVTN